MKEIFVPVKDYENKYLISNKGNVFSINRNRLMNLTENEKGYLTVEFTKDGKRKRMRVHRIVAITFIENPLERKEVNHIDGNKKNNSVENLEWCTRSENVKHAYRTGLRKPIMKRR